MALIIMILIAIAISTLMVIAEDRKDERIPVIAKMIVALMASLAVSIAIRIMEG